MAITIKPVRADQEIKTLRNTGTSMIDIAKSNKINYDSLTADLSAITQTINSHNDKINQRRINNKSTKYNALMSDEVQEFGQTIELGKFNETTQTYDPWTNEEISKKLLKFEKDMTTKYKNNIYKGDDKAWEHFESYFYTNLKNADGKAHTGNKKKILADTAISWSIYKSSQDKDISSTVANEGMWVKMNMLIEKEKEMYASAVNAGIDNIDIAKNIQEIEAKFLIKAIEAGHEKQLFGDGINGNTTGHDWTTILSEINSDKEYFGRVLTKDEKEIAVNYVKEKAIEQDFFEDRNKEQHNEKLYKDNIKAIRDGTLTISKIENLPFTMDEKGMKIKDGLLTYARSKMLGLLPTESNITLFRQLREKVTKMDVTSVHQNVFLSQNEELKKKYTTKDNPDGLMSVLDLVNEGLISDEDYNRLETIMNDPQLTTDLREFNKLIVAYDDLIQGKLKKYDMNSTVRLYQLESVLESKFKEGLKNGKKADDLLHPFHEDFILTDDLLEKYVLSLPKQAEEISNQLKTITNDNAAITWKEAGGPEWNDEMKKKYNNDSEAFNNGTEMQEFMQTENYKVWLEQNINAPVNNELEKIGKVKIDGQTESNGFTFKTFKDGSVEPMPKPNILPFFNYNRYFEWVKLYGKTHNVDGTPKEK